MMSYNTLTSSPYDNPSSSNLSLLDNAKDGKKFESDGVHPKPFYYKLWANNMADVMGI